MRELIFHLGDRKTGSTSIQDTLRRKIWTGGKSLDYPARLHHGSFAHFLSGQLNKENGEKKIDKLKTQIAESEAEVVVISSEHFEVVPPTAVKKVIDEHFGALGRQIRLIAYVRPHIDRLVSSYAERVKLGLYLGTMSQFAGNNRARDRFIYHARFNAWRRVFGDSFELRPMIRAELHQNCVVRDFLRFSFDGTPFQLTEDPESNSSSTVRDLAMLRELHVRFGNRGKPSQNETVIGRNLARVMAVHAEARPIKPRLHRELAKDCARYFKNDADMLDATFFADRPMARALEGAIKGAGEAPISIMLEDNFTPDEVRSLRIWCDFVTWMAARDPDGWGNHFSNMRLAAEADKSAADGSSIIGNLIGMARRVLRADS